MTVALMQEFARLFDVCEHAAPAAEITLATKLAKWALPDSTEATVAEYVAMRKVRKHAHPGMSSLYQKANAALLEELWGIDEDVADGKWCVRRSVCV